MCVCVYVLLPPRRVKQQSFQELAGNGDPHGSRAAFNYPESHFNEVLPNALNHSIFRGTRLSAAVLELGGERTPAPGHLLGSPSGWWPQRQLIVVG